MSLSVADLALRQGRIGASEIAALVGEDSFQSPLDLWLKKTGRVKDEPSTQSEWGHRIEGLVADQFAQKHGVTLAKTPTLTCDLFPLAAATPDRLIVGQPACLEAKNVGYRMMHKWRVGSDGWRAPAYVQLQGQWQCLVGGFDRFHVAAFLGGRDDYDEAFAYDPQLAGELYEIAAKFWRDHVLADRQPDPTNSAKDREYLARRYPTTTGNLLSSTEEIDALARQYAAARTAAKEAKSGKDEAQNKLQDRIGEQGGYAAPWGQVTWLPKAKGSTAWAKVAVEAGADAALIAKHTKAPGRAFSLKFGDEDDGDE